MIHVRIDNHHSTAVDIYVNISPKNIITSSSPIPSNEHIYDHLFDTKNYTSRQSKIIKNRIDYNIRPINKKNYTLEQILDNVETIQKQYEQVVNNRIKSTTTTSSSCFFTFKQITKILKNLRTIKTKTNNEIDENNYLENKSPFVFGGETLQWIALPQDDNHIYENEFIS
ncbi:unnamed protein product [Rotaria sp. Silwood1]|nr:unnamed protein product [Rotaria sp. Silwood1]CAF1558895.1 unnamed protein product [Rotaria sp. Silwood1]CAF3671923.1 unnamed protein product [Rotaria sp. Silwood1]CAF4881181.1 unnamed protein product [Rotaria sp. Silwood1]